MLLKKAEDAEQLLSPAQLAALELQQEMDAPLYLSPDEVAARDTIPDAADTIPDRRPPDADVLDAPAATQGAATTIADAVRAGVVAAVEAMQQGPKVAPSPAGPRRWKKTPHRDAEHRTLYWILEEIHGDVAPE